MKTSRLLIGLLVCFAITACTPSEEEVHPKRRSARADNLQRYMSKAQQYRAAAQARSKPIVDKPLLTEMTLREFLPQLPDLRISAQIFAQKNELDSTIQKNYARLAADQVAAMLDQLRTEAVTAALEAKNPQELAAKLNEQTAAYSQKMAEFVQLQQQASWTMPNAQQSRMSKQALEQAVLSLLEGISRDYGEVCAQKTKVILQKTADDYWLVLSSVNSREAMEQELSRVGEEADKAFRETIMQYGDPILAVSGEQAASLRARLITAHQQMENQFEKLYGKEAVLQTRDIFERYKNTVDALLRNPIRLSAMQAQLDQAGEAYRKEMTQLQAELNEELEHRAAKAGEQMVSAAEK